MADPSVLSPELQTQLVRERLQLAIQQTQRVKLPHTLVDLALAWVAWESGLRHGAWIYLLVMTVSHLGRSALLSRMLASGRYSTAQLMQASMAALAYLGLLKAALTLAVFTQPNSDWHELFTMILIGNAAGAVATAGGHLRTYLSWAIPFGSGLVGGWLLHGGVEGMLIALLVVALFWVLSGYVREQGEAQEKLLGLNDSLRAARDRAERANEARTRFFAAASHDLRQPLTALSYSVATVEALAQLKQDEKLGIVGGSLRRSLTEGQTLLNSLLEISQLDAGAVEVRRQALDLATLVAGVVEALQPQADDRGLQLQVSGLERSFPVRTDEALLRRVLQNLLGNALKFTPAGGLVQVQLHADAEGVAVDLIDNGPGIASELQDRVFEEFFQVGNAARNRSQGLGLGLAIVRRLVALLELRLSLDSEPGRGSRFTLHLPLLAGSDLPPPAAVAKSGTLLPAAAQALRLLVVDDEAPIREALALLLSNLGWEVRGADAQAQALQQLGDGWQPDALLLDFRLRDGASGLDVLRALRQQGCLAPAWLVTGETAPQRIQQAREAGLPVLYKPVDGLALASLLRQAVGGPSAVETSSPETRGGLSLRSSTGGKRKLVFPAPPNRRSTTGSAMRPLLWGWPAIALALASQLCAAGPLADGLQLRDEGRLHQSAARLQQALQDAGTAGERQRAGIALVGVLIDGGRFDEADATLQAALPSSEGEARAAWLLEAGRLALLRGDRRAAASAFGDSARLAGAQLTLRQRAELNLASLEAAPLRRTRLQTLEPQLRSAALLLNLAAQARQLNEPALAHRALQRSLQADGRSQRQQVEALDAMAELYEGRQQPADALQLTREALRLLPQLPEGQQIDLRVRLEWRLARLQPRHGAAALAAYQRAVAQLESARIDWPLQADDGRSSYEALFRPLYMELVDGLLHAAAAAPADEQQALLRRARDALEQLRQAEMQDYLGDRCEVDAVKGSSATELPPGSAVIYPLLLADRVELLVEDSRGLAALPSSATPAAVREAAGQLAKRLRERADGHQAPARSLHQALLQPLQAWLNERGNHTLVWINEGALRLVPMAALYDGRQYAIERYALVNALGMSMTNTEAPRDAQPKAGQALVAGAGRFGPVVDKLAQEAWAQPLRRQLLGAVADQAGATRSIQADRLRDALELPGVSQEVRTVGQLLSSQALQDAGFTIERFSGELQQSSYRVVHIASHGVFGGSAASSYLLAYDDLLTLGGLQDLLQSDAARRRPIELLTLSACQTAEGNERAPLGIAGAAMKARARAVLGTLWPVDDAATVQLMNDFYGGWTRGTQAAQSSSPSKGMALRQAQLALLAKPETRHPYYWAPFALIGNWL